MFSSAVYRYYNYFLNLNYIEKAHFLCMFSLTFLFIAYFVFIVRWEYIMRFLW